MTEQVAGESLALPFYNNLKDEEIEYVVDKLKQALNK
ncbi:perosamine synthetase [Halarsenatibacter silvermanii]|uniref:Perosamine synthetase n=1 Tax=Halarsenatibacter silvermanii TaxID=321763 RepID=A0A1G9S965_9FIRM|nr:perosamine synthetase [Halarsenatibacter silvermanii]